MNTPNSGVPHQMPPPADPLFRLYGEWRSLTQAEGDAIEGAAWDHLLMLQQAKERLQSEIEVAEKIGGAGRNPAIAGILKELIHMETENRERLANLRETAQNDKAAMDRSRFDLQRLHKRLVVPPFTGWQCYS